MHCGKMKWYSLMCWCLCKNKWNVSFLYIMRTVSIGSITFMVHRSSEFLYHLLLFLVESSILRFICVWKYKLTRETSCKCMYNVAFIFHRFLCNKNWIYCHIPSTFLYSCLQFLVSSITEANKQIAFLHHLLLYGTFGAVIYYLYHHR